MDRLYHLEQTLPLNLSDNSNYENVEFIVLNYNSSDGIDEWIKQKMMSEIKQRKLIYIKTTEPKFFKMSHAKNIVTKFASGDIVCNLDADNFTGEGFARYINEQFNKDQNIFLTAGKEGLWDLMGRVCLWKSDFLKLKGYDEKILDYGYEDNDFYYRLKNEIKRTEVKITTSKFLKAISHSTKERMNNGVYNSEIESGLLLNENNVVKAFIFKKNNTFEHLTLIPTSDETSLMIEKNETKYGNWKIKEEMLECKYGEIGNTILLSSNDGGQTYLTSEGTYQKLPLTEVCFNYSLLKGNSIFQENILFKNDVNPSGFGEGLIFEPLV